MTQKKLIWALLALWAVLYALSFWQAATLPPTGDSFLRGMNRLMAFLGWQGAAAGAALILWGTARGDRPIGPGLRWLSRIPLLLALALALGLTALVLWARFSKPAPMSAPTTPTAVTQPVASD
ncbi:MAG: hypothetical protein QNK42_09360 [Pseudodonghicola sp.]|nr:hypothetical protein [Pseudodonghicola sp.]